MEASRTDLRQPFLLSEGHTHEEEHAPAHDGAEDAPLRLYPERWRVLAIFAGLALINQAMWLSFAPTAPETAARYRVAELGVTTLNASAAALFVPGAWLCAFFLPRHGLRSTVVGAAAAQTVGAAVRLVAEVFVRPHVSEHAAFMVLCLGQAVVNLAAPVFLNLPAVVAESWFDASGRDVAMAVGTLAPLVGQGAGSALAGTLVTGATASGTGSLLAVQVALCLALCCAAALGFRSAPPTAPSKAAEAAIRSHQAQAALRVSSESRLDEVGAGEDGLFAAQAPETAGPLALWASLLRRPQFVLLLISFSVGLSLGSAIMTLLGELLGKCEYSPAVAGEASGILMLCGAAAALITGYLLGATHAYKTILRIVATGTCLAGLLFMRALRPGARLEILATSGVLGAWMVSALPVLIANAVEETYPNGEAAAALLFTFSSPLQVAFTFILQYLVSMQGNSCGSVASPSRLFILISAAAGCLAPVIAFNGGQYRRLAEGESQTERA